MADCCKGCVLTSLDFQGVTLLTLGHVVSVLTMHEVKKLIQGVVHCQHSAPSAWSHRSSVSSVVTEETWVLLAGGKHFERHMTTDARASGCARVEGFKEVSNIKAEPLSSECSAVAIARGWLYSTE